MDHARQQLDYVSATLAVETLTPSKSALQLCSDISSGKISVERAVNEICRKYGVEKTHSHG